MHDDGRHERANNHPHRFIVIADRIEDLRLEMVLRLWAEAVIDEIDDVLQIQPCPLVDVRWLVTVEDEEEVMDEVLSLAEVLKFLMDLEVAGVGLLTLCQKIHQTLKDTDVWIPLRH